MRPLTWCVVSAVLSFLPVSVASAGRLSAADIGNPHTVGGMAREYSSRMGASLSEATAVCVAIDAAPTRSPNAPLP